MSCYRLIDVEKTNYSVSMLCKVLKVARSGYHDWTDGARFKRDRGNAALTERIRKTHHRSRETCGAPESMPSPEPWECAVAASVLPG